MAVTKIAARQLKELRTPTFIVGNGTDIEATGGKILTKLILPYAMTIIGWKLWTDVDTNATIDIWYHASADPTNSDSLPGGSGTKPSLSSAKAASGTSMTNWTTALAEGGRLILEIESNSAAKRISFTLIGY